MNTMEVPLIQGAFPKNHAADIITQMFAVKIQYHEQMIEHLQQEEDIKMREKHIKQLQESLANARKALETAGPICNLSATIHIN